MMGGSADRRASDGGKTLDLAVAARKETDATHSGNVTLSINGVSKGALT